MGDSTQLHQVLLNLCLNARDAMPDGGKLSLSGKNVELGNEEVRGHSPVQAGPFIALTVRDNGHGIPPEHIGQIFDPFFTTKVREKATGLGLSTAHGIVRSHGGFVTVKSAPGSGATFTVLLPAAPGFIAPVEKPAAPVARGRGELILVVDDEPMITDTLQMMLELGGYQAITAANGTEALAAFQSRQGELKLVLTDFMMPGMNGAALIHALHAHDPALKFILFTGLLEPEQRSQLEADGVNCMLSKPCEEQKLLRAIAEQLNKVK
jgi:CheY-like chemotaxis protein